MVPYSTFNYKCASCLATNEHKSAQCSSCGAAKPTSLPPYTVTCTMCNTVNEVASSNLRKHAGTVASATKKAAVATKTFAEVSALCRTVAEAVAVC